MDAVDQRVPTGAPWVISDDTGAMYEVRFDDNPGVPVMLYKGTYAALRHLFEVAPGSAKDARQFIADLTNTQNDLGVDPSRTEVVVDRARLERLLNVARAWVSEGASNGEGWDAAFMRANLQPGDLDPIP